MYRIQEYAFMGLFLNHFYPACGSPMILDKEFSEV